MNQYRYKCPTKGCEIDTILVNVHEDVIEYFGFCCPFCQDHMVRDDTHQSERDKVLDEIEIPFKELLKAIGTVYKLQMALPGDYNVELGEAIQVCFDKFRFIDGMIEELRRQVNHEPV